MEDDKTIEEILRGMDVNTILFVGNAMGINQVNIECNNLSWAAGMSKVFELIFLVGRWYSEQGFTIMF